MNIQWPFFKKFGFASFVVATALCYALAMSIGSIFLPMAWGEPGHVPISGFDWFMHILIWGGFGLVMGLFLWFGDSRRNTTIS